MKIDRLETSVSEFQFSSLTVTMHFENFNPVTPNLLGVNAIASYYLHAFLDGLLGSLFSFDEKRTQFLHFPVLIVKFRGNIRSNELDLVALWIIWAN